MMNGKEMAARTEQAAPAKKFISVQALARRWNVSDATIRRLIEEGDLRGVRIRKNRKIAVESVAEYEARSAF